MAEYGRYGPLSLTWFVPGFYRVSSPYGPRVVGGVYGMHRGVDIGRNLSPAEGIEGKPIVAPRSGRVVSVARGHASMGNMAELDLGGGLVARFMHCRSLAVTPGQFVARGEAVAAAGNTGRSTAAHVHAEFRQDGEYVDPALLYPEILGA